MCTSVVYRNGNTYFGRNLDYEVSYNPSLVIVPHNFEFNFANGLKLTNHNAIVGIALELDGFPLYYDGINDKGLGMAGLNFAGNAKYYPIDDTKTNIANYEIIPYVLSQCSTVDDVKAMFKNAIITNQRVSPNLPVSELHWQVADSKQAIVIEQTKDGLFIYDNPVEVLTNNPPFEQQLRNLDNYRSVSNSDSKNLIAPEVNLDQYSRGMGSIFLPGGVDSESRFVRCVFTKFCSVANKDEASSVSQFFHILGNVAQVKGECKLAQNSYEYTIYTSCGNLEKGLFYYTTYNNSQIVCCDMNKENLETKDLISYRIDDIQNFFNVSDTI